MPHDQPRRRPAWPAELNAAVDAALAAEQARPPDGVSWADWERVLAARRAEATRPVEELRHLGPKVEADQVLLTVDEVLTRKSEGGRFLELRTARVVTATGSCYLSGVAAAFLQQLRVAKTMLLDWHHLRQRCLELSSRICRSKTAKAQLLRRLSQHLWRGAVAAAIAVLEAQRAETKNVAKLDELIGYLQARAPWIPNYRQRRIEQRFIGSGHVEKANDLIVARRQKNRGMQWSVETSDALAALRTLMLNGGWDRYWQQHEVLPLAAA